MGLQPSQGARYPVERHLRGKGRETDGGDESDSEEYGKGHRKKKKKKGKEATEKGEAGAQQGKGASGSK